VETTDRLRQQFGQQLGDGRRSRHGLRAAFGRPAVGSGGAVDYLQAALRIISAIRQDEINPVTFAVKLGDWAIPGDPMYYDTRTPIFSSIISGI